MGRTEKDAIDMAVQSNYMYFGGYDLRVERRPSDNCASRMMVQMESPSFVPPGDLFYLVAAWNCGVATPYSVAAMLHKMHKENPDKAIPDISLSDEMEHGAVQSRLRAMLTCGCFLTRRVCDKKSDRSIVTYTLSPEAARFAFHQLELPVNMPTSVWDRWAMGKEFTRQFLVSRWISFNLESECIQHFRRYKKFPKPEGQRGQHETTYLWFSSEKNDKKYSVLVHPFVFTADPAVNNEYENEINSITIPFRMLTDFLLYCKNGTENGSEFIGGLVLLVDREDDLPRLAKLVAEYIPSEFHQQIVLTSNGLMGTQKKNSMYFGVNGHFVPPDEQMF